MVSLLGTQSITVELGANEPWPEDVKLYEPQEKDQMLMSDLAHCIGVQAFLRMCHLPFTVQQCYNAEFMSPSGQLPFIKVGAFVLSELDPIIGFVNTKVLTNSNIPHDISVPFDKHAQEGFFTGHHLSDHLDNSQKADMRAYMSLAETVFSCSQLYFSWFDKETYNLVTKPRYSHGMPWPLNHFLTRRKCRQVKRFLKAKQWMEKTYEQVCEELEMACQALSDRLGSQEQYFFGDKPTELDALVFGHLYAILTVSLPNGVLETAVRRATCANLVDFTQRVWENFFHDGERNKRSVLTR